MQELRSPPSTAFGLGFLEGGGELGGLCRARQWTATALGDAAAWPQSLKTAVAMTLASDFPMIVLWGRELIQIYNDAYRM
ncbi:MAG: hypothetical protein LC659_11545, partial [Myxococcales bacterium]|nr:hypothetical protein [Myxococcales bacterium]